MSAPLTPEELEEGMTEIHDRLVAIAYDLIKTGMEGGFCLETNAILCATMAAGNSIAQIAAVTLKPFNQESTQKILRGAITNLEKLAPWNPSPEQIAAFAVRNDISPETAALLISDARTLHLT